MKKSPLSRRDFLKLTWTSLWGFILTACRIDVDAESTPTPTSVPTSTDTPAPELEKDAAPAVEEEAAPTNTPTETPIPCFKLLTPEDGATFEAIGKITFSWETMQGAEKYMLEFTLPTGQPVAFETTETSITRYIESFTLGGEFLWKVTALDKQNNIICVTAPFSFSKPTSEVPKQDKSSDGGNGGSDASSGIDWSDNAID